MEGQLTTCDDGAPPAGGAPWRYRLRPSLELLPTSAGDVYLLRPGSESELVIRRPEPSDRALLERLARGPLHVAAGDPAAARLQPLVDAGAVVRERPEEVSPALDGEDAARFARQLPYFAEAGDSAAAHRRLRRATVVVLGCGGVGTWALGGLACTGVGHFVLVDDDTVEESNLNRQVLYRAGDVGKAKVDLAAAWLRAFDSRTRVTALRRRIGAAAELEPLLDGADALVQAADHPPYELGRWVNTACIRRGVPYITAGQQPPLLRIGPTVVPGRSACFACQERALQRAWPLYDELTRYRREHPSEATTLGPPSGIVGAVVAQELLHLLLGWTPVATEGRALLLDMHGLETRWHAFERDPACPACGPGAG